MQEDKLSAMERIRLEALAQAVAVTISRGGLSVEDIVKRADAFEDYIVSGRQQPR